MSDVLIRDVPDDVLAAIDTQAARLGLSRNEYIRRELRNVAQRSASSVTADDLQRFAHTFADLTDPDVMDQAWT
ncbi:ribbon-helix-helix protein, CopG family [Saccharomonospora sp. NPDC046836]|uniref:type II toxin-antitoxin system VapB family antitoxin n=1 Tax=Saccharomonospora sp. NPDC046836 TaxID=3156921 RepID=UPI0033C5A611